MSKAFINEDQVKEEEGETPEQKLPAGTKNYMTPKGFARLQEELHDLLHKKRPELTVVIAWAAGNGDRSENADYIYGKRRLREIDRRIHFLTKRLEGAEVIDPSQVKSEQIFFGATVVVEDEEGRHKTYSIVGVDESEPGAGKLSWISPIARALLKKNVGDLVSFSSPKGMRELEILEIRYETIE